MAFIVLTGQFEPGTRVRLYRVADEAVLRVGEGGDLVGERTSDSAGSVGFDGLDAGAYYIASGSDPYTSAPIQKRCRGLTEFDGAESAQTSNRPNLNPPVGTQEKPAPVEPIGAPAAVLQTGVPAGLPLGVTSS